MPTPTTAEAAVIPIIHAFHSDSVLYPGGYQVPVKIRNTATMLTSDPTAPHRYRTPNGARLASSNLRGLARMAKNTSRNRIAVELHNTMARPAYSARHGYYGPPPRRPTRK